MYVYSSIHNANVITERYNNNLIANNNLTLRRLRRAYWKKTNRKFVFYDNITLSSCSRVYV